MKRILEMHKKWMEEGTYRKEYGVLEAEFTAAPVISDPKQRTVGKQIKQQRERA
jgi:hypothetical protein